jgi:outer membrane biosynthesis protein TonB
MNKSNQPQYVRMNPFARASAQPPQTQAEVPAPPTETPAAPPVAPPAGPTKAELDALATAVRRRVTRLAVVFVGVCLLLVAGEIWITQELLNRQRSAVDQNSAIIIEHTRRFRTAVEVQEMQLKQLMLDAHIHKKNIETIASDARSAYASVLSNNIIVAGLSRTVAATAQSTEGDALAVRDARRGSQQLEIEFNVALSRIRKDYLTLSSNLVLAFEADLKSRSAQLDKRVKEAEALLANVRNSATEAEKLRKTIEASLAALRSTPPPVATPNTAPAPAPAPVAPATVTTPAAAPKPIAPSPTPVQPAPVPKAIAPTNPPPANPAPVPSPAPAQPKN